MLRGRQEPGLVREAARSRSGADEAQAESGAPRARSQESCKRLSKLCQKDSGAIGTSSPWPKIKRIKPQKRKKKEKKRQGVEKQLC